MTEKPNRGREDERAEKMTATTMGYIDDEDEWVEKTTVTTTGWTRKKTTINKKEVSIHRAGMALCMDVTYRTAQG